jgi:hypothetical protein
MADWEIVQADVMRWAEEYEGPKFHALLTDAPFHLTPNDGGLTECPKCGAKMARRYRFCHQCGAEMDTEAAKSGFMNAKWDGGMLAFQPELWQALARHLYPGAFIFSYASSRGYHRLAVALEDAGMVYQPDVFIEGVGVVELPGFLLWVQSQSFPKATRIDSQLDKRAGAERAVVGRRKRNGGPTKMLPERGYNANPGGFEQDDGWVVETAPATPLARAWGPWRYGGQILRDCATPIVVAQKPWTMPRLDCIVETGAGALWVEGARISSQPPSLLPHVSACGRSFSLPDTQGLNDTLFGEQESPHDVLCRIVFALRYCNTDGKDQGHSGADQGDMWPDRALCEFLQDRLYPNGVWYGLDVSSELNSLSGYQSCPHLYDELFRHVQEAAQDGAPSLADALEHIHSALSKPSHSRFADSDRLSNSDVLDLSLSLCQLLAGDLYVSIISHTAPPRKVTKRTSNKFSGLCNAGKDGHFRQGDNFADAHPSGRWPPNYAVSHFSRVLPDGTVWGCIPITETVPCPDCAGDGGNGRACETCGGTGVVEVEAVERVRGCPGGSFQREMTSKGYKGGGLGQRKAKDHSPTNLQKPGYADSDGTEPVPRYACARHCPDCDCWWRSEEATECPECGGEGEWACSVRRLGEDSGERIVGPRQRGKNSPGSIFGCPGKSGSKEGYSDKGTAARFYPNPSYWAETAEALALGQVRKYQAKPSRAERDAGLEDWPLEWHDNAVSRASQIRGEENSTRGSLSKPRRNPHPTLKPLSLNIWLSKLLLPPDIYAPRRLLCPFAGTGSEGIGGLLAGFEHVTMIEQLAEYCEIAETRTRFWTGWSERTNETEPKAILKAYRKAQKKPKPMKPTQEPQQLALGVA